jgi:hypothetical protein
MASAKKSTTGPSFRSILSRGFLPAELPPSFSTSAYAKVVSGNFAALPAVYADEKKNTRIMRHSYTKVGIFRRSLGIPNPLTFVSLAKEVSTSWRQIANHVQQSPYSVSTPVSGARRAIKPLHDMAEPLERRLKIRTGAKYCLHTDVSQCYSSLYTHSIPWALHTKNVAKAKKNDKTLLGNRLDAVIRRTQDSQTVGVPIGPDTSLVAAEIILTAVDIDLAKHVTGAGFRFIDDYEFCFSTYAEAETALSAISNVLEDYELRVNTKKTRIIELPAPLDNDWASEIRLLPVDKNDPKSQRFQLMRVFDRAAILSKQHNDATVLKYAVSRIRNTQADSTNHLLVESLLLQILTADPSVIADVLESLIDLEDKGHATDLGQLGAALNSIIEVHAPPRHDNEVAWALWGALRWRISLSPQAITALKKCRNAVVGILALDALRKGLAPALDTTWYQLLMSEQELRDQHWLLSYEANVQGWLPSNSPKDHVLNDPGFAFLKLNGVRFYNPVTRASKIPPKRRRKPRVEISEGLAGLLPEFSPVQ